MALKNFRILNFMLEKSVNIWYIISCIIMFYLENETQNERMYEK